MIFKKELDEYPLLPIPGISEEELKGYHGYVAAVRIDTLPRSGQMLIVDVFSGRSRKKLALRFVSDGHTFQVAQEIPAKQWTQRIPENLLHRESAASTKQDEKIVREFLGKESYWCGFTSGVVRVISGFASDVMGRARQKAAERKFELTKQHFAMYPALPVDLPLYCDAHIFKREYIFITALDKGKRHGRCSGCGRRFSAPRETRSGQRTTCPKCGAAAVYRGDWTSAVEEHEQICVAAKVDGQLLLRWTNVLRYITTDAGKSYTFDDYAYNLYLHTPQGPKTYFYKYINRPYYYGPDWYRGNLGDFCYDSTYVYTDNLADVFGERYYNVNLQKGLAGRDAEIPFAVLLNSLRDIPAAEYLFRLGMPSLAASAKNLMRGDVSGTHPSFTGVLGVSKQFMPLYQRYDVTVTEHLVIKAYGKWVSPDAFEAYRALEIERDRTDAARELLQTMSFERFVRYFTQQKQTHPRIQISRLLILYRDYIQMSEALGVDLSHKAVRFPADCMKAHDQISTRFNEIKHEAENKLFAKKASALYEQLHVTEYAKDGLCVVLPQKRSDLITEGQSLNHCVGLDSYFKNHIAGTRMIFFIRKAGDPAKPFFTMELDMTSFRILQLYGFGDCSAPADVRKFAEGYAKRLARANMTAARAS